MSQLLFLGEVARSTSRPGQHGALVYGQPGLCHEAVLITNTVHTNYWCRAKQDEHTERVTDTCITTGSFVSMLLPLHISITKSGRIHTADM